MIKQKKSFSQKVLKKIKSLTTTQDVRESIQEAIRDKTEGDQSLYGFSKKERYILENILSINKLRIKDVMIPRASIVSVSIESNLNDLLNLLNKESHSRLPVYRKDLDNVLGMVHIKDLLKFFNKKEEDFSISSILKNVLYVPPSMPLLNLLLKMQSTRLHMAMVIDEHGGTDGLVTIEDIVEEIVGEIDDEHDKSEQNTFIKINENTFEVTGDITLEKLKSITNLNLPNENDIDTIGGFLFTLINRIPSIGEIIVYQNNIKFEILEANPRKIKKIKIYKSF
jgi:magnesium and cobalt transporter